MLYFLRGGSENMEICEREYGNCKNEAKYVDHVGDKVCEECMKKAIEYGVATRQHFQLLKEINDNSRTNH